MLRNSWHIIFYRVGAGQCHTIGAGMHPVCLFFLCWTVPYRQLSAGKRLWEMPSYLSLVLETILVCIIFFGAGQRHMTIRCWRVLLICRCWKVPCLSLVLGSAACIGAGGFHVGY